MEVSESEYPVVFSRGDHIKSLGIFSEGDGLDLELDSLMNSEPKFPEKGQKSSDRVVHHAVGKNCSIRHGNTATLGNQEAAFQSWNDFKTEFDDVFRESEEKIASSQLDPVTSVAAPTPQPLGVADMRHDLIIEMITSLHDSQQCAGEVEGKTLKQALPSSSPLDSATAPLIHPQSSPTRPPKQLLSLGTLETIHESEIDRLLESVDNTTVSRLQRHPRIGTDSDFCSLTDSDTASPSSPHPKGAWGMLEGSTSDSGNDELMKQLFHLSLTQADGHQGLGEGKSVLSPAQINGCQINKAVLVQTNGRQDGTVVLSPTQTSGKASTAQSHHDDPQNLSSEHTG